MYKNFFRIGFGGCGCALVDTFEEHVYRLFRSYLLEKYKELAKWSKIFSEDDRLKMKANLERLEKLIFEEKLDLDNLGNIENHLGEWSETLENVKGGMKRSYDINPVEKIEEIIKNLKMRVRGIKNEYGEWLEALTVDSYSGGKKADTYRHFYNQHLNDSRQIRISEFGMDILNAEGFNHHPELQMLPLSIQEVRNEVYKDMDSKIKKYNKLASRGHFFFLGLGGGTGTGIISPLAQEFSKGMRGAFTLGVLGGKGDNDYLNSQQPWFRRCFNMLLALNDLIVNAALDGLILVDNEILMENITPKLKVRESAKLDDNNSLKLFLQNEFDMEWVKDAEISHDRISGPDRTSIIKINKDDNFAEIVITWERQAEGTARLKISDGGVYTLDVYMAETDEKIVMGRQNDQRIDEEMIRRIFLAFCQTACDISVDSREGIDWSQLSGAMTAFDHSAMGKEGVKNPIFVPCYASNDGEGNSAQLIKSALKDGKFAKCNHTNADRVFVYMRNIEETDKENIKNALKDSEIITEGNNKIDEIGFINSSDQVKKELRSKKVIVFDVKGKKQIKKNEILILLRNPDIKESLSERLAIAKNFVSLLTEFIKLVDRSSLNPLKSIRQIINSPETMENFWNSDEVKKIEIPEDGIEKYLFTWGTNKHFITREEQRNIKASVKKMLPNNPDWIEQAKITTQNNIVIIKKNDDDDVGAKIIIDEESSGATLYFNMEKISKLKGKMDGSWLKIYEGVEDPKKKILEEAGYFLSPEIKNISDDKIYENYKKMKTVVQTLSGEKGIINAAIGKLEKNEWPIFDKPVFELKQAVASGDEINVTTMLINDSISNALGSETVKNTFNRYQLVGLIHLKDQKFVEGNKIDDYILTDKAKAALSSSDLMAELEKINEKIDDPYSLFTKVSKETFLESSKKIITAEDDINFPKLLILSLLYTKWEPLFSLDEENKDQIREYLTDLFSLDEENKDQIRESLTDLSFDVGEFTWEKDGDGEILRTGEILNISGGASGQIGILIDNEEGSNIKKIHVGFFKKNVNTNVESIKGELDNGEINLLWDKLDTSASLPPQYEVVKEERGYSIKGGVNNNFYIYIRDSNSLRVYKDRSADQNLRVQESGNKLKVYRKRK